MSGGRQLNLVSWLITPAINMDAQQNEYIRLKIADAFQNGNPLKLMYSVDFDGNSPGTATWNEIGSDHIADLINNSGFYDNVYETTDPIDISFLNGNVSFALVYDSNAGNITTTVQFESIQLFGN